MSSLQVTLDRNTDVIRVRLAGAIDERADLDGLFAVLDQNAILDLAGVVRMNSIGVQRWIARCREFTASHTLSIEAASYPVATQANCVANLFASGTIESCLAPYYCVTCSRNLMVLVRAEELAGTDAAPEKTCLTCGSVLEFDELDSYFAFLRQA